MTNDLISKKAALLAFIDKGQHSRRYKWGEPWGLCGEEIREVLESLPTRKAHWYDGDISDDMPYWCSYCGCSNNRESKFCPNCGAEMEVNK